MGPVRHGRNVEVGELEIGLVDEGRRVERLGRASLSQGSGQTDEFVVHQPIEHVKRSGIARGRVVQELGYVGSLRHCGRVRTHRD